MRRTLAGSAPWDRSPVPHRHCYCRGPETRSGPGTEVPGPLLTHLDHALAARGPGHALVLAMVTLPVADEAAAEMVQKLGELPVGSAETVKLATPDGLV